MAEQSGTSFGPHPVCLIAVTPAGVTDNLRLKGRVQGMLGGVMGLSYVAGPLVGGFLTDHAGWRWIFLVNLPIGVVVVLLIVTRLPWRRGAGTAASPDYAGVAVFTGAVATLLVGLHERAPWMLAVALLLAVVFVLVERHVAEPLMPLRLFRVRAYALACAAAFGGAFALYVSLVFLPRLLQGVWNVSATSSGVRMYPLMLGMVAGSGITGALITWVRPCLFVGAALIGIGAVVLGGIGADSSAVLLATGMGLVGLGLGPTMSGLTVVIQTAVPAEYLGTATSNLGFFRQVGGSVVLAVADTVYRSSAGSTPTSTAHAITTVTGILAFVGAVLLLLATAGLPRSPRTTAVLVPQNR
ncbi:MFS transporter [Micromonospora sp. NPDC051925]|uniref:MFS transporter n=1 Tax=Micromonospora sp. NPDC051925 TaxID=3364288 RepID=UPI0037C6AB68